MDETVASLEKLSFLFQLSVDNFISQSKLKQEVKCKYTKKAKLKINYFFHKNDIFCVVSHKSRTVFIRNLDRVKQKVCIRTMEMTLTV